MINKNTIDYLQLLLAILVIKNLLIIFQSWFFSKYLFGILKFFNVKVFSQIIGFNYLQYIKNDTGKYIKNITKDLEYLFLGIYSSIISIFGELIYILGIIIFASKIMSINVNIDHLYISIICFLIFFTGWRLSANLGVTRNKNENFIYDFLNNSFRGFKEIKIFKANKHFVNHFKIIITKYFNSRVYAGVIQTLPKLTLEIFILSFFYLSYKISNLTLDEFLPTIAVLAFSAIRILPSFNKIFTQLNYSIFFEKSIDEIQYLLNLPKKNENQIKKIKKFKYMFLKNVSFFYKSKNNKKNFIIKNFNYKFEKGKIYGLFSPSGSGKTTFLNIMSGMISPKTGNYYLDKKKYTFSSKIYQIIDVSYLGQEPFIINSNLIDNINLTFKNSYNRDGLNYIKKYLSEFNLNHINHSKIILSNINLNYKLSGGEKQRVAFIRCLIQQSDLMILDEPSSSLDKKNEEMLFKKLKSLKKDKIIILSFHDKNLKKYIDKVINI